MSGTTRTGAGAEAASDADTEPRSAPRTGPRPREPTTISRASAYRASASAGRRRDPRRRSRRPCRPRLAPSRPFGLRGRGRAASFREAPRRSRHGRASSASRPTLGAGRLRRDERLPALLEIRGLPDAARGARTHTGSGPPPGPQARTRTAAGVGDDAVRRAMDGGGGPGAGIACSAKPVGARRSAGALGWRGRRTPAPAWASSWTMAVAPPSDTGQPGPDTGPARSRGSGGPRERQPGPCSH